MRGTLALSVALTKSWLRSRSGVFFSFLFPLLLLVVFTLIFGGSTGKYKLWVQNLDVASGEPTALSEAFVDALNATGALEIEEVPPGISLDNFVASKLASFERVRILVIPEGFESKILNASLVARINVLIDTMERVLESFPLPERDRAMMEQGVKQLRGFNETLSAEVASLRLIVEPSDTGAKAVRGIVQSVLGEFQRVVIGASKVVELNVDELAKRPLRSVDYYVPGYIAAFIMTNGIIGVTSVVSDLRSKGVIKRLEATPLSKYSWLVGVALNQVLLALILTATMVSVGWAFFGFRALPDHYAVLLIILGSLAFAYLGVIIGTSVRSAEAASALGNAIAFPMMFLSGAFWPIEIMPSYLQLVAKLLPLYYFHEGLRQIMIFQNLSGALPSFAILGGFCVLSLGVGAKVVKWREE